MTATRDQGEFDALVMSARKRFQVRRRDLEFGVEQGSVNINRDQPDSHENIVIGDNGNRCCGLLCRIERYISACVIYHKWLTCSGSDIFHTASAFC